MSKDFLVLPAGRHSAVGRHLERRMAFAPVRVSGADGLKSTASLDANITLPHSPMNAPEFTPPIDHRNVGEKFHLAFGPFHRGRNELHDLIGLDMGGVRAIGRLAEILGYKRHQAIEQVRALDANLG
jgi:hypothetical protein